MNIDGEITTDETETDWIIVAVVDVCLNLYKY